MAGVAGLRYSGASTKVMPMLVGLSLCRTTAGFRVLGANRGVTLMVKTITSGGGLNSNKVVQSRSGYKVEPRTTAIDPAGVSQRDVSTAFRKTLVEVGPGYSPGKMPATGIANARQGPLGAGPGGFGRTIYKSGSQSPTPPAREMPAGRNTLAEYGPDSVTARGKR